MEVHYRWLNSTLLTCWMAMSGDVIAGRQQVILEALGALHQALRVIMAWLTRGKYNEHERKGEKWICALKRWDQERLGYIDGWMNREEGKEARLTEWVRGSFRQHWSHWSLASVCLRCGNWGNSIPSTPWKCRRISPIRLAKSPPLCCHVWRGEMKVWISETSPSLL